MTSTKINQLQLLQQNLQSLMQQKQQFQSQQVELDSALNELQSTEKAYKIVGGVMLAVPKEKLVHEIKEKKEMVELRLKSFIQQEEKIQQNFEKLQKEVIAEMQQGNSKKKIISSSKIILS